MNEVVRWILGIMFTLILGAYGYTWSIGNAASVSIKDSEDRTTRQLDIIERKIDRVLEWQWQERNKK